MRTSALLYVAHRLDEDVLAGWDHLRTSCPPTGCRPVFLYDNSRSDFAESETLRAADAWLFTSADLSRRFTLHTYDPERPVDQGNAIFPILAFHRDQPDHGFYWRIEYDVLFDGPWADLLEHYRDDDADLLATTLGRPVVQPGWAWWKTVRRPWSVWRPPPLIRAFMPIARLSARACARLDRAYARGWAGHDEVLVPTVLARGGLRIEDLGGGGEFVRPENIDRFYTNTPARQGLAPGTFVCPPQEASVHEATGKLYHPVKERARWLADRAARRDAGRVL